MLVKNETTSKDTIPSSVAMLMCLRHSRNSNEKGPRNIRAILSGHGALPPHVSINALLSVPATELYETIGGDEGKGIPKSVK